LLNATHTLGLELHAFGVRNSNVLDGVFATMTRARIDGLVVYPDIFAFTQRTRIVGLAAGRRLPAIYGLREFAEGGGLMSYGASLPDLWRRAASYADRILKGAKPADLPVEQPTTFELVINMRTAKALGLTIPPSILARADELIQ
jgi:putative ABC transport system substrate-binding protein